jgi:hypothetical protein
MPFRIHTSLQMLWDRSSRDVLPASVVCWVEGGGTSIRNTTLVDLSPATKGLNGTKQACGRFECTHENFFPTTPKYHAVNFWTRDLLARQRRRL